MAMAPSVRRSAAPHSAAPHDRPGPRERAASRARPSLSHRTALSALPLLCALAHAAQPPKGWDVTRPSQREAPLEILFAIKQTNLAALEAALLASSDPGSPEYGRHMSSDMVHALVAPTAASIGAVERFLAAHGLHAEHATPNGDFLRVVLPVWKAEQLLDTRYYEYVHNASGVVAHRAPHGYLLPADVAAAVDFVSPTTHWPAVGRSVKALRARSGAPSHGGLGPDKSPPPVRPSAVNTRLSHHNTPKTLRQLYSVGDTLGSTDANRQAVTAFLGQEYSSLALHAFWAKYCEGITCGKGEPNLVGDLTRGMPGVEAMLDIETITGIAGNISSEFWGFSGRSKDDPHNEPFLKWLTTVASTPDAEVPKVFSTSYGEDEGSWSPAAATRLNVEFQKAGMRGITLLFAAGDEGANCKGGVFVPEGPASSPFVTAVGGTTPATGFPEPGSETAVGLSSGGFSDYWPMPGWQTSAVTTYLRSATGLPPSTRKYNTSGRAYPDIAAQATSYCVVPAGCDVAGTSCSSPTAAGIFALLNDLRLKLGKSTLGFINPLIYANTEAFNDVTTGASSGCFLGPGWPAAPGWDAVTGVGTPNYAKLAKVVAALP